MFFDVIFKRKPKPSEDIYHKWWVEDHERVFQLQEQVSAIRQYLLPFAGMDSHQGEFDSTLQLARNARDLLKSDTAYIQQIEREKEQLQNQMDADRQQMQGHIGGLRVLLEGASIDVGRLMKERDTWKAKAQKKKQPA